MAGPADLRGPARQRAVGRAWQPLPAIDRQAAAASFDTARFPGGSNWPLDLLAASAAWRLGGSGLLDRPGQAAPTPATRWTARCGCSPPAWPTGG